LGGLFEQLFKLPLVLAEQDPAGRVGEEQEGRDDDAQEDDEGRPPTARLPGPVRPE
jgi:hypothetical protein